MSKPKTSLFSDFPPEKRPGFLSDLRELLSCRQDEIKRMFEVAIGTIDPKMNAGERRDVRDRLYGASQKPRYRVDAALNVGRFLLRHLATLQEFELDRSLEQEANGWGPDLLAAEELAQPEAERLGQLASLFLEHVKPMRRAEQRRFYTEGVLPSFKSAGTTVGLRAVLERRFRAGDPLANFKPRVEALVPVISVSLQLERAPHENVIFQIDPVSLDHLVDVLKAAQATAAAMKELPKTIRSYTEDEGDAS